MSSDVEIARLALLKLGANPINSFAETTTEAVMASSFYPLSRDALLVRHPWRFAVVLATLPQLLNVPLGDYDYAFQLPAECLRVLSAGRPPNSENIAYALADQRQLWTDEDAVLLRYIRRPTPDIFPAYFVDALVDRLAAEMAVPLTESTTRADGLYQIAERKFATARLVDSQMATPAVIDTGLLVNNR
jgi:hypothetical protein